jgi:hypothetical protein
MVFEILFEKFNRFYENLFHKHGLFVSKYPKTIITVSLIVNIILALGVFKLKMIKDTDELFMLVNSDAKRDEKLFSNVFDKSSELINKEFYLHQLFDLGTGAEIMFRVREDSNKNILEKKYFDEMLMIHRKLLENVLVKNENETIKFDDVCAKRFGKCWIEGSELLNSEGFFNYLKTSSMTLRKNETDSLADSSLEDNIYISESGGMNFLAVVLGKDFKFILNDNDPLVNIESNQTYGYAKIFKIRYQMKYKIAANNIKGILWEREFLKFVKNSLNSTLLSYTYATSKSLEDEIEANVGFDSKLVSMTFMFIVIFATIFMSVGSNIITSPGMMLPTAGIFAAFFGVSSSVGLLSFIGYPSCSLVAIIPFLVLGIII